MATRRNAMYPMLGILALALSVFVLTAPANRGQAQEPKSKKPGAANPRGAGAGVVAPEAIAKFAANAKNLLANGDFEHGKQTPTGWQAIDGLSSFWVDDPDGKRGKVIKFDTDVLQSQAYPWWKKIAEGAGANDAPKKLPTVEPKYDTLAGLDGVWFWSDPIAVEKGKAYWLTIDVKGPAMLAWLVGYPTPPSTAFGADAAAFQGYLLQQAGKFKNERNREPFLHTYAWKGQLALGGSSEWKTYSRREKPFRPTENTPNVKFVRVLLYPFWPPGEYYVDNVRLVEYREAVKDASP